MQQTMFDILDDFVGTCSCTKGRHVYKCTSGGAPAQIVLDENAKVITINGEPYAIKRKGNQQVLNIRGKDWVTTIHNALVYRTKGPDGKIYYVAISASKIILLRNEYPPTRR